MYEFKKEDAFRFAEFKGIQYKVVRNQIVFMKCPYCGIFSDKKINLQSILKQVSFIASVLLVVRMET